MRGCCLHQQLAGHHDKKHSASGLWPLLLTSQTAQAAHGLDDAPLHHPAGWTGSGEGLATPWGRRSGPQGEGWTWHHQGGALLSPTEGRRPPQGTEGRGPGCYGGSSGSRPALEGVCGGNLPGAAWWGWTMVGQAVPQHMQRLGGQQEHSTLLWNREASLAMEPAAPSGGVHHVVLTTSLAQQSGQSSSTVFYTHTHPTHTVSRLLACSSLPDSR